MSTFDDQIAHYLQSLSGPDFDAAYHRLIEVGPEVMPYLERAFKNTVDAPTRQTLVKIAWNTRAQRSLLLLQEALEDGHDQVWKEALDGLVALGGQEALAIAIQVRGRTTHDRLPWIDEAIQQMGEKP